jgi:hypothetical protein
MERKKRSGCPRNNFLEGGGYSGIPLFFVARFLNARGSERLQFFREREDDVDADILWTQRTRPQDLEISQKNARFPQRPHRSSFSWEAERRTKHRLRKLSTESDHSQNERRNLSTSLSDKSD